MKIQGLQLGSAHLIRLSRICFWRAAATSIVSIKSTTLSTCSSRIFTTPAISPVMHSTQLMINSGIVTAAEISRRRDCLTVLVGKGGTLRRGDAQPGAYADGPRVRKTGRAAAHADKDWQKQLRTAIPIRRLAFNLPSYLQSRGTDVSSSHLPHKPQRRSYRLSIESQDL